ncbi:hypothetical protein CR513_62745, partial [Mucuna pruriens]
MKSTIDYCFSFGLGVFSWCSKKQDIVAQSTIEAEYVQPTVAMNQAIWLRDVQREVKLLYRRTEDQSVDVLPKALPKKPIYILLINKIRGGTNYTNN